MASKTYAPEVEAYLDAELAAARLAAAKSERPRRDVVGEDVSLTVVATLRAALVRAIRLYGATTLLALLPAFVIVARAGLNALPRLGVSSDGWLSGAVQGVIVAAAAWAALVTLWQARNTVGRARGLPPATLRRASERSRYEELPSLMDVGAKLGVALAALSALLWLALSGGDPLWLLVALVALPPFFLVATVSLNSLVSGLGAVGAVNEAPIPLPGEARLNERITQLQQMRDWLKDDKLRAMMDDVIGKQVVKSERRQAAYSVVVGVLSLLAGWLLSAVSPVSALAQLLPR